MLFTLIAWSGYGVSARLASAYTSQPRSSPEWEKVFSNPMATAAAIDRISYITRSSFRVGVRCRCYRTSEAQGRAVRKNDNVQTTYYTRPRAAKVM